MSSKLINYRRVAKNLSSIYGASVKQKIVVFESDDWGSIRMPSLAAKSSMENLGLNMSSVYNQYDTLASWEDYVGLFEVLDSFRDSRQYPPVFTAVSIVANPDFEKIKESGFREYFYEPFTTTLQRYDRVNTFELLQEGIRRRIFVPQFHGREHINVNQWMQALQSNDSRTMSAFNHGMWDFGDDTSHGYLAAFDVRDIKDLTHHSAILDDGFRLFEKIYGYKPEYFVPPNGPFNNSLNSILSVNGIKYRSASKIQNEPIGNGKTRKVLHWLGQADRSGIKYITRNCFFEPSHPGKDWVDSCMNDIKIAFRWNKPAIISAHRVNFIGSLVPENRSKGLIQLKTLLQGIKKRWPDVQYMTTTELGMVISRKGPLNSLSSTYP